MPKEGPLLAGLRRILGWLNRLTRGHMLRHGCGCALANAGHDTRAIQVWMGHRTSSTQYIIRS